MDDHVWRSRRTIRAGATTAALAATLLLGGAAAAQDTGTEPAVPTIPADTGVQQPGVALGPSRDGSGAMGGRSERGDRGSQGGRSGGPGDARGGGRSGGSQLGISTGRGSVEVVANDGTSLTLQTADGWTRTIDTTGVVLTADGATITLADIAVGDDVRIVQTRNADGSYTVTGIQLQPTRVSGSVTAVSTDGFTMTESDGTVVTVRVSDTTTWRIRGDSTPSLADLTAGMSITVTGDAQADGSIDATSVTVR
ncbi:MAG: hypothetical protein KF809_08045 [Chloroflexi bacterium]|nr:hypothetical protein [Chloroflexota bacterium]